MHHFFHHEKEKSLIYFFGFLFFIIILRLFWIQIIKHEEYSEQLNKQHYKESLLLPDRGNIYVLDKGGHPLKLTENITLYDLAMDPNELTTFSGGVPMKPYFIELISPVIYKHLCQIKGMQEVSPENCLKNIENFTEVDLLPKAPELFYYGEDIFSPEYLSFDFTGYQENYQNIINTFSEEKALELIKNKLNVKIKNGEKIANYLGYYTNPDFLQAVQALQLPYLKIEHSNYLYIFPRNIGNTYRAKQEVKALLSKWKYPIPEYYEKLFEIQEWRYIKLASGLNPLLAKEIKDLKIKHQWERSEIDPPKRLVRTPILYGLILEPFVTRYYPYGDFMANVLGYVNKKGVAFYGIEERFDDMLKGKKGEIKGRSSSFAGSMGANDFEIITPTDGDDIYLTIDIGLQKATEDIAKKELIDLEADSISVLILDTEDGTVKASVNAPSFNPNNYNDAYILQPLGEEHRNIIDDETYIDIPVYIFSGGSYRTATLGERTNTGLQKHLASNIFGPQVFVDKNISVPFEPGSTFKVFTVGIGLDTNEMDLNETYNDEGFVKVGIQTIKNATKICMGHNSFLHALVYSCNVGMVKIVQKIGKFVFYNYLHKLGFGELSEIELAGEKEGFVDDVNTVSFARFLNNAFGQGLTTTQIQFASAYAALINGGTYIKPSIIEQIKHKEPQKQNTNNLQNIQKRQQIFKPETSEYIAESLANVLTTNPEVSYTANISGFKLGGKSGTAQISFKGKYQRGEGRTNGTFAGIVDIDNPKYVILVWVRRPRKNQWGGYTAGRVFRQVAEYLLTYDM